MGDPVGGGEKSQNMVLTDLQHVSNDFKTKQFFSKIFKNFLSATWGTVGDPVPHYRDPPIALTVPATIVSEYKPKM